MSQIPSILPLRYLVVDDDHFTCDCIAKLLHRWGADDVQSIDNAPEAIDWLNKAAPLPDIIICDLNMPDMNGIEFMQILAKERFTGYIVLMSASTPMLNSFRALVQANGLNVLGALSKPLRVEQIVPLLSELPDKKYAKG